MRAPNVTVLASAPVALVNTNAEGVPRAGVTNVGDVANTSDPVPVSSVTALARFALVDVARKVATPAASPLTPVEIGKPVAFVRTPEAGVPNAGVVSVGEVSVLLVRVCVAVSVTIVSVIAGKVSV